MSPNHGKFHYSGPIGRKLHRIIGGGERKNGERWPAAGFFRGHSARRRDARVLGKGLRRRFSFRINRSDGNQSLQYVRGLPGRRSLFTSRKASTHRANGISRWQLCREMGYLEDHMMQDVSLDEMAQLVGFSPSQFARLFKISTGTPPYKWCLDARIKRTQELLLLGEDSISSYRDPDRFR